MDVGAVRAPTIRRSIHANDYDNRSRYCKVSLSGPRRRCRRPGAHPPPVEASRRPGVLPETASMSGWDRGLRLVALLVARAPSTWPFGAVDAAGLRQALRQASEE